MILRNLVHSDILSMLIDLFSYTRAPLVVLYGIEGTVVFIKLNQLELESNSDHV